MKSTPAGSVSLADGKLNGRASKLLNDEEKKEVTLWVTERKELTKKDLEVKASMLADHIFAISKAVKGEVIKMSDTDMKRVQAAFKKLKSAQDKKNTQT